MGCVGSKGEVKKDDDNKNGAVAIPKKLTPE